MFTLETHLISDRPGHSVSFFPKEYKLFKKNIYGNGFSLCPEFNGVAQEIFLQWCSFKIKDMDIQDCAERLACQLFY